MHSDHQQARQLGRQNGLPTSSLAAANDSLRKSLFKSALLIVLFVLCLGIAHHFDSRAEAEEQAITAQLAARMQQVQRDGGWLTVVANAYAQGRDDALRARPGSPEARQLAQACTSLSQGVRP
jgi:uncharacterized membrane protein